MLKAPELPALEYPETRETAPPVFEETLVYPPEIPMRPPVLPGTHVAARLLAERLITIFDAIPSTADAVIVITFPVMKFDPAVVMEIPTMASLLHVSSRAAPLPWLEPPLTLILPDGIAIVPSEQVFEEQPDEQELSRLPERPVLVQDW
jgi:hypothetical protein